MKRHGFFRGTLCLLLWKSVLNSACAAAAEVATTPIPDSSGLAGSVIRLFGALTLVFALFMGFIWIWKRWQRVGGQRRVHRKLQILESRPLGNRQSLCVVGYEGRRLLLDSHIREWPY